MLIPDMPERDYHAHPALSSTQARTLLESPSHYKWAIDHPRADTAAFDVGTAAHSKVLGVGAGVIAYPDEHLTPSGNVSTKKETVAWAEGQRALGLTPISPDQVWAVDAMAEAVLAHPAARALFERAGIPEASLFATDPDTGIDVRCRFDHLSDPEGDNWTATDLKTTRGGHASTRGFIKSVASYGYDVQQGHYLDTATFAYDREPEFVFVVVEKDAPFRVAVHRLHDSWALMGREKAAIARQRLAEARATGDWWGYPTEITTLEAPLWVHYEHEERFDTPFSEIEVSSHG